MIELTLQQVKIGISKRVEIHVIHVNLLPMTTNEFQIFSEPTLILFSNGKNIWKTNGVLSKGEIIDKILELN